MSLAFRYVTSAPLNNFEATAPDGTVVGIIPGAFVYANLAGAVARSLKGTDESLASINVVRLLNLDVFVAFTLLGLLALVPILVKAWRSRSSGFRSKHN